MSWINRKSPLVTCSSQLLNIRFSNLYQFQYRSFRSNKWFVLNDEEVTEFDSTVFDPEDYAETGSKSKAKKKIIKAGASDAERLLKYERHFEIQRLLSDLHGFVDTSDNRNADISRCLLNSTLSSRNAYMLTYTRRTSEPSITPRKPPSDILDLVMADNADFDNELKEYTEL